MNFEPFCTLGWLWAPATRMIVKFTTFEVIYAVLFVCLTVELEVHPKY